VLELVLTLLRCQSLHSLLTLSLNGVNFGARPADIAPELREAADELPLAPRPAGKAAGARSRAVADAMDRCVAGLAEAQAGAAGAPSAQLEQASERGAG
jgi:hypothetical protein